MQEEKSQLFFSFSGMLGLSSPYLGAARPFQAGKWRGTCDLVRALEEGASVTVVGSAWGSGPESRHGKNHWLLLDASVLPW